MAKVGRYVLGNLVISVIAGALTFLWLTVSVPVAPATVGFFVVYRLLEDYVLVPRIIGRAVDIPPLVTVVAVLVGATLLGLVGALVAIPISAGVLLLVREMLFPRLDAA